MTTRPDSFLTHAYVDFGDGNMITESATLVIKGRENQFDKMVYLQSVLDLSSNNLFGEIPKEVTSLRGLRSLNLSGNHLRGSIPDKIGSMTWMESLDFSRN